MCVCVPCLPAFLRTTHPFHLASSHKQQHRFERKKGIGLALTALKELQQQRPTSQPAGSSNAVLVVAGGYDVRLAENREHLLELQELAEQLDIKQQVLFVPSFTDR